MYKSSKNNSKFDQRAIERVEQSLDAIHATYGKDLIEVSLFGSYAKGTSRKYSSIDLLIVVEKTDERFVKRNAHLQRILNEENQVPQIDPLVYTEDEIIELTKKKESFVDSMLKETIVVWNNFNRINLTDIPPSSLIPSRYLAAVPNLEELDD